MTCIRPEGDSDGMSPSVGFAPCVVRPSGRPCGQFEMPANALCGCGNDPVEFPARVVSRIPVRDAGVVAYRAACARACAVLTHGSSPSAVGYPGRTMCHLPHDPDR